MHLVDVVNGADLVLPARRLAANGFDAWAQVLASGFEGYVAKDEASEYRGGPTRSWLKVKVRGWTDAEARWKRVRLDYQRAAEVYRRNVEALHDAPLGEHFGTTLVQSVDARMHLAWCLAELGAFAEGRGHGEDALRLAEALDHPYSLAWACAAVGHLYLRQGALPQAKGPREPGLALNQALHFPGVMHMCRLRLGAAYALSGRVLEALPPLERVLEQDVAIRHTRDVVWLGEGYMLAGRVEEAMRLGQRALKAARTQQPPGDQAYALWLLGEIAAHGDPLEAVEAETHY